MNKTEQANINSSVEAIFDNAVKEVYKVISNTNPVRLRSCSAVVFETEHYYVLRSYNTFVACIRKDTDTLYDALRFVYGYTNTSAQHISKFNHDYCNGYWGCEHVLTWRQI